MEKTKVETKGRGDIRLDARIRRERIGDFEDLAKKIIELIENDSLRYKIAQRGYESISKFREEDSARIFIQLMDLHVSVSV